MSTNETRIDKVAEAYTNHKMLETDDYAHAEAREFVTMLDAADGEAANLDIEGEPVVVGVGEEPKKKPDFNPKAVFAAIIALTLLIGGLGYYGGYRNAPVPADPVEHVLTFKAGEYVPEEIAEGDNVKLTFGMDVLAVFKHERWEVTPLFADERTYSISPGGVCGVIVTTTVNNDLPTHVDYKGNTVHCRGLYVGAPAPEHHVRNLRVRGD